MSSTPRCAACRRCVQPGGDGRRLPRLETPMPSRGPVRYAVVGLGHIAQVAVLPAFAHARRNSRLVAVVSGDRGQAARVGRALRPRARPSTTTTTTPASSRSTPSTSRCRTRMHAEYTIRAARAGVHVLCEKPMAVTVEECERMIDACRRAPRQADDRLPPALRGDQPGGSSSWCAQGRIGEPKFFNSSFSMTVRRGDIRTKTELRRRHALRHRRLLHQRRALPVPRRAEGGRWPSRSTAAPATLAEIDESTGAILRFDGERVASFVTSFNAADVAVVPHRRHQGRHPRRSGLRVRRGSRLHADRRRQDARARRIGKRDQFAPRAAALLRLHPAAIASPSRPARKGCRTCASSRRSTNRPKTGKPVADPAVPEDEAAHRPAAHHPARRQQAARSSRCRAPAWTEVRADPRRRSHGE